MATVSKHSNGTDTHCRRSKEPAEDRSGGTPEERRVHPGTRVRRQADMSPVPIVALWPPITRRERDAGRWPT